MKKIINAGCLQEWKQTKNGVEWLWNFRFFFNEQMRLQNVFFIGQLKRRSWNFILTVNYNLTNSNEKFANVFVNNSNLLHVIYIIAKY